MDVCLNGKFVPQEQATISVDDAGFQHAVGLFETMGAYHGKVFRLDAHLARLQTSAVQLGLAKELDLPALADAVNRTLSHNKLQRARVRLTVTPGPLSMLRRGQAATPPEPTVLIVPAEPTAYDPDYFTKGITALIAAPAVSPMDPMAGHKTLAYWARLRALRQAASVGAGEAIWLNVTNHLASGSVSNLFLVKDQQLLTPFARGEEVEGALPAPVLPGVVRGAILNIASEQKIPVHKRMLTVNDLLEADEVFLTNSSWLVLPVTQVEKKTIASGDVGPVTTLLRTELLSLIERETAPAAEPTPSPASEPGKP